jgi:hypothetical protein
MTLTINSMNLLSWQFNQKTMNVPSANVVAPRQQNAGPRFRGPNTGIVATIFVLLFIAGLAPVTAFGGMPYFPGPTASVGEMVNFFSHRQAGVLLCAFFHFGSAIPLGIFTATMIARLKFLGVRAAGLEIALFGGFATAIGLLVGTSFLWATTYPEIPESHDLLNAIYRVSFGIGGPGYAVPFGLLAAGISIPAWFFKLLPKWVAILGLFVGVAGVLSWFEILSVHFLPLIPLTRFPGFVWIIAAGFTVGQRQKAVTG